MAKRKLVFRVGSCLAVAVATVALSACDEEETISNPVPDMAVEGDSSAAQDDVSSNPMPDGGDTTDGAVAPPDVADMGATPSAECLAYCTLVAASCGSLFAGEEECLSTCAGYDASGTEGDTMGDTVQCRIYHADAAADDATLHCPHAGPDGGGVCI